MLYKIVAGNNDHWVSHTHTPHAHTHVHTRTHAEGTVLNLEIWNNRFCRMSQNHSPFSLLQFILLSIYLPLSLSLPLHLSVFLSMSLSLPAGEVSNQPAGSGSWGAPIYGNQYTGLPASRGQGHIWGRSTGHWAQPTTTAGQSFLRVPCAVLCCIVSVLVARTKPLRLRRSMGGRLSRNLNNGWALSRNRVSGGGCLLCTCTWALTLTRPKTGGGGGGGGCLISSGRLPRIIPTHVYNYNYECMLIVCMSIISPPPPSPQVSRSSSMDESDVNNNDLISNLRMRGNSEKAIS